MRSKREHLECNDGDHYTYDMSLYPQLLSKPDVRYYIAHHNGYFFRLFFQRIAVFSGNVNSLEEGITMSIGYLAYRLRQPVDKIKDMIAEEEAMRVLSKLGSSGDIDANCTGA